MKNILLIIFTILASTCAFHSLAAESKDISIDSCQYTITDYKRWDDYLSLRKFVESGSPEKNRLSPLCDAMPNSKFIIHSANDNDPVKNFEVTVNECTFKIIIKTNGDSITVYEKEMKSCLSQKPYKIINIDTSNGYNIWNLSCSNGNTAWVNNHNNDFYQYGGNASGTEKALEQAMIKACYSEKAKTKQKSSDDVDFNKIIYHTPYGKLVDLYIKGDRKYLLNKDNNNLVMYAVSVEKNSYDVIYDAFKHSSNDKKIINQVNLNGDSLLTLIIKKHKELIDSLGDRDHIHSLSKYIKVLRKNNASYGEFPELSSYDENKKREKIETKSILENYIHNESRLSKDKAISNLKNLDGQFHYCPEMKEKDTRNINREDVKDCIIWLSSVDSGKITGYTEDFYNFIKNKNFSQKELIILANEVYDNFF